jgi:hypothetical protein
VCCVWVEANVPYGVEYVTRLRAMVRRHLDAPHRFVCLTDRPWRLADVETIPIPNPRPLFGWWSKIECFRPGRFADRVLYLDLDTLVVANLAPVVDYHSSFALIPHAGSFQPHDGRVIVPRFNSSVMVWDAGECDALFTGWRPDVAARLHGDQDFVGEQRPQADAMPAEWFPRISAIQGGPVPTTAKVVLCKKPKNEIAIQRWPWVRDVWRAA